MDDWIERGLRASLQALALPPGHQRAYHAPGCPTCELIEDFLHPVGASNDPTQGLTASQLDALATLREHLEQLPADETDCDNDMALDGPGWAHIRLLATAGLAVFGWSLDPPPPYVEVSRGVFQRR